MTRIILILMVLLLIACGKKEDSGSSAKTKDLFSIWTGVSTGVVFDFTGLSFGTGRLMTFVFTSGAKCTCTLDLIGSQAAGNYALSSCAYTGGGSGNPGCSSLNSSGKFSKTDVELSICDSSSTTCNKYR